MMKRFCVVSLCALVVISLASIAFAQEIQGARPMFRALPPHGTNAQQNPAVQLPQWTFSSGVSPAVIVGTDPSKTNTTTTIPVGIIPIKMVYGPSNGNKTFDPNTTYVGSYTATAMIAASPIFNSLFDYNQGGTDLGKTQYEDAYERGNFWGFGVDSNTSYHLVFAKPIIAPEQTFNVPSGIGNVITNPWSGIPTGTADINWFDTQLQTLILKFHQIQPNTLPIFLTYNVYLTEFGQCCIGGYHSANGPAPGGQTYSYTTTIAQDGAIPVFSEDISALSHELGEWIVDPFTTNTACGGLMEVGDPLENNPAFGTHPYSINGFTFHPQDLVFMRYFGAPATTSVNDWWTFQNFGFSRVCQNGQ